MHLLKVKGHRSIQKEEKMLWNVNIIEEIELGDGGKVSVLKAK